MAFSAAARSAAARTSSSPGPSSPNHGDVIPKEALAKIPKGVPVHGINNKGQHVAGVFHGTNPNGIPQVGHYSTGKVHLMSGGPLRFHAGKLGYGMFGKRLTLQKIGRQSLRGTQRVLGRSGTQTPTIGASRRSISQPRGSKPSIPKGMPIHGLAAKGGAHVAGLSVGQNALNQPLIQSPSDNSLYALNPKTVRMHGTGTLSGTFLGGTHSLSSFTSGSNYGSPAGLSAGGSSLGF